MEIRRVATHVDQAVDGPKRVDQLLVCHADAIPRRRVGAGRKSGARGRRHGAANRNA
jgi:hypothetical protein